MLKRFQSNKKVEQGLDLYLNGLILRVFLKFQSNKKVEQGLDYILSLGGITPVGFNPTKK